MLRHLLAIRCILFGCLALLTIAVPAGALQLVTNQEASLPPDEMPKLTFRGSPTRRPTILLLAPAQGAGLVTSPLSLKIRFQAFGGSKINADTIVVTYIKSPAINLTPRLAPFIRADGIEVPDAEVPPGNHQFRIELKDMEGRIGGTVFSIQVAK